MRYKHIIWDVDGTLLETSRGVLMAVNHVLNDHGLAKLTSEQEAILLSINRIQEAFRIVCRLTDSDALLFANQYREAYKNLYLYEADVYPNAMEVMAQLQNERYSQVVATNKREDYAILLCDHFGISRFCSHIYGSDGKNAKKIDVLQRCFTQMKYTNPEEVVMVGDTEKDREAANAVGIHFIGVNYGYGFKNVTNSANSMMEVLLMILNAQ